MPALHPPAIALPPHRVPTDELLGHLTDVYRDHPRIDDAHQAITATTVRTRYFSRPLDELSHPIGSPDERVHHHLQDSCALAEAAARRALDEAGLGAEDIDCLVLASTTGALTPGLDVLLCERLSLPPETRRIHAPQVGCAGGAFILARAAEQITAHPGSTALAVGADLCGHFLHPGDTAMDGMIFKGLLGDAAGACIVEDAVTHPGPSIDDTWDYLTPGSSDIVGYDMRHNGFHAHNSPRLFDAVSTAATAMSEWFHDGAETTPPRPPEFVVTHPGSPRVLDTMLESMQCKTDLVDTARESLRDIGNVGSASLLDVLARTFAQPPPPGAQGLVVGIGPGVTAIALRMTWHT